MCPYVLPAPGGASSPPPGYGTYQFAQYRGTSASPARPLEARFAPRTSTQHGGSPEGVETRRGAQQQRETFGAHGDWSCVSRDTGPLNAYGSHGCDELELGPPREVDARGDLVVLHHLSELNRRDCERSKELAALGGPKRVSQYLAGNPEAVAVARRVGAGNNQRGETL